MHCDPSGLIEPQERSVDFQSAESADGGRLVSKRLLVAAGRLLEDERPHPSAGLRSGDALRPEQETVFKAFAEYLLELATRPDVPDRDRERESARCRIVLPPRTGKTVIAGHIIARTGLDAVFLVPTRALVTQSACELARQVPDAPVGVFYGDEKRVVRSGINVTTYASLDHHLKSESLPKPIRDSALVFVDEAHHTMTTRRVALLRDAFEPEAIRVALTATPDYDDERRLGHFFPDLIHEIDLAEALDLGLLAPARVWVAEVDADGSVVHIKAGEYESAPLGQLMSSAPFFRAVEVFRYQEVNADLPCLVCCASRQQAYDLRQYLEEHRPAGRPRPGLVLGETTPQERRRVLSGFERGSIDTLIQVGVLIEGWNAPRCKLLLDLAPSLSRVRATQKYFRVMTRLGDQEARIFVLLPRDLPRVPVLPMDLFIPPGDEYTCGELLRPSKGGGASPLLRRQRSPVKGVRLKKRILACAGLERPRLDPDDSGQVKAVLASCPDFDPNAPCALSRFKGLFFQHPLFAGTGQTLLRWLRLPFRRDAYLSWLAELNPEAAARSRLRQKGTSDGELWLDVSEDVEFFLEACCGPSGRQGMPVEPFPGTLRALAGGVGDESSPERPYFAKELQSQLRRVLQKITDRERDILVRHGGLFGEPKETLDEIGKRQGVLRECIRQIEARALRKLRHPSRAKHLEPWS